MTPITASTHEARLVFVTEHDDPPQAVRAQSAYAAPIERTVDQDATLWGAHVRTAREYAELLGVWFDTLFAINTFHVQCPQATSRTTTIYERRVFWVQVQRRPDDEEEETETPHDQRPALMRRPALMTYRFTPNDAPPYITAWVSPHPAPWKLDRPPTVRLDYDPSAPDDEQHCAAVAELVVNTGLRCSAVGAYHNTRLVVWVCTDSTEGV